MSLKISINLYLHINLVSVWLYWDLTATSIPHRRDSLYPHIVPSYGIHMSNWYLYEVWWNYVSSLQAQGYYYFSPWVSMELQRLLSSFTGRSSAEWAVQQWSMPSTPEWVHLCRASTDPWNKTLPFSPMSTSLAVSWFKVRYLWTRTSSAWSTSSRDPARLESELRVLPVQGASYLHQRTFLFND